MTMNVRHIALIAPVVLLAACQGAEPVAPEQAQPASPVLAASANARIPGRYIVVFNDNVRDVPGLARGLAAGNGGEVGYIYEAALKGFSITLGSAQAAEAIARNPNVAFVEQDQVVTASAIQSGATWGLDRIDQRNLPLSTSYTYTATGTGVRAYIVDTGILPTHTEFGTRASTGYDAITPTAPKADCNGHGTHVAGTVGGTTYGVAKNVTLIGVRVLDCNGSGSLTGVIAGVNWVAANAIKPAVANMSLGAGASLSLDNAVAGAISKGITFVVAAGNSNANACNYSPARAANAITVGATGSTDVRAGYSNFGKCLDIFAPGSSITSAWFTSSTALVTISGTSMASPHVAGVAALFLQRKPTSLPKLVRDSLVANATANKVTSAGTGSPNRLLFSNY
ncbi:MAG: S8 family peptidase [Gemmatimonadota bacterium]|nr:S8 family peptidase [Gemmatimonadota bacterium]MDQ8172609.1 S8 family peptidase [Gemmatimonadota bacterium]